LKKIYHISSTHHWYQAQQFHDVTA